jgi:hypothetical protein
MNEHLGFTAVVKGRRPVLTAGIAMPVSDNKMGTPVVFADDTLNSASLGPAMRVDMGRRLITADSGGKYPNAWR